MAKKAIEAAKKDLGNGKSSVVSKSPRSPGGSGRENSNGRESAEVQRLGMGFGRMALQDAAKRKVEEEAAAKRKARDENQEDISYARNQFSSQKSISSDQYFQRGNYDANNQNEAKERLKNFKGQTSISSNQYFGREEEEEEDGQGYRTGNGNGAGEDDFGQDLEATAREYYTRFMANPDVQQGIESFRAGAMKVSFEEFGTHVLRNA